MRSMGGINRLPVETYHCVKCKLKYEDQDVRDTWKCPKCNNLIHVHAEGYNDPNKHIAIIRKRASELEVGDLILMPTQLDGGAYRVLGITKLKNKLGIGLSGWGQYKLDSETPVNCCIGKWL